MLVVFFYRLVEFEIAQGFFDDPGHIGGGGAYGEVEVCSAADAFEGFIEVVDVEEEDYLGAGALSGYE